MVGQRDALAAGPLVDEEAGLGGLAAAADVEGVDDVGEAEPDRGLGELRGILVAAVAGPAGVQGTGFGPMCSRGPRPGGARRGRPAAAHDMSWEDIVSEVSRKRADRGGFDDRIFLEYVDQAR